MPEFPTSERSESSGPPASSSALSDVGRDRPTLAKSRLVTIYGVWVVVAALYWPSTLALNALWTNASKETYTHGYLVLLIALWLIFRDRKRLALEPVQPRPGALIALGLLSAFWTWSWRASIQEAHLMLLPLILFAAIIAAFGLRIARVLAFPIGFLYFAMPVWSDVNGIVQGLSARVTGALIWITGLPAYRVADVIHLPRGAIEIAGSCSGLHELIVGLALAALYGEITHQPLRRRLTWLGVMGALSLIVNWIRIFTVMVAAYESDMHSSLVKHHYWLGWWLFAGALALFLWWTGRSSAPETRENASVDDQHNVGAPSKPVTAAHVGLTLAVLALFPAWAYEMNWSHSGHATPVSITWPTPPRGWSRVHPAFVTEWRPHFVRTSGQSLASFTDASGSRVQAFAVAYRVQSQHAKLISYWNHLLGDAGVLRGRSVHTVVSRSGRWREMVAVDASGHRSLIWMRYQIGNRFFVRPRISQLWYGLVTLIEQPPVSSLTALRTPCTPDCAAARRRLLATSAWMRPTLH